MLVYTSNNESLNLLDTAISSGGEGEIHSVLSKPVRFKNDICVKIYFKPKRTKLIENKLKYMVANPPGQIYSANNMIGWPLDIVYDSQKRFIGFVMPLAYRDSEPLIVMTTKNISKRLNPIWADKYDRRLGAISMIARLKLICNIAIPVYILHSTKRYVLKDFKPENVLVTYDGKVTLVDMDSVQITDNNRLLFPGTAATPNYIPPEYYTKNAGKNINVPIESSWDYFALGVVFYQIMFGLHPYVVTPAVIKDDSCNEIFQNIAQNLFPFGVNTTKIGSYPPPHNNFIRIPMELQLLFKGAFSNDPKKRPTPDTWVKTIKDVIRKNPMPQSVFGTVSVKSTPINVSVKIDNIYVGITPIRIKAKSGFHRIDLLGDDIFKVYDNVEVKEGEVTNINVNFSNESSSYSDKSNFNNNSLTSSNSGCMFSSLIIAVGVFIILMLFYISYTNDDNEIIITTPKDDVMYREDVNTESLQDETVDNKAFDDCYIVEEEYDSVIVDGDCDTIG